MRCSPIAPVRRLAAVAIGLSAILIATARGEDFRTWKDASGKFTIKAKFVSLEDGKVTLEREDGTEIEIELKRLGAADQKYLADRPKGDDDPFKPAAPKDPFKAKAKAKAATGSGSGEPKTVATDWSGARLVIPAPSGEEWKVALGAAPAPAPSATAKLRPIGLPPKGNFFERTKGLVVSAGGKMAVVGYNLDDPKPLGVTRIVECDLEKGKMLGSAATPGLMAPLALSDDGGRVLMRRDEFGFGNNDRLELWSLSGAGLKKDRAFVPYGDQNGGDRDVKWAAFLGDEKLATVSNAGKLAVWGLDGLEPLYYLSIEGGCVPALSPDRKLLAFTTAKEIGVLDVAEGAVLAIQAKPHAPFPALAFSPSGKRLALVSIDKLRAYDVASGALEREILLTGLHTGGLVQFAGEGHALVGGQYLIDLENQVRLWTYQGAEMAAQAGGFTLFAISSHNAPGALIPAALPHPGALASLKQAMADPNFFVLKPGTTAKIDVGGLADAGRRDKAAAALAEALRKNGAQAGPGGTITLAATTEVGKERDVSYHTFGSFGQKTYKVREYISRVKFVSGGKTAWETSSYNIPPMVMLKEGQTMEAYLKEQEKSNYDFFGQVELPKFVTRPTGAPTLGTSQVGTSGVR